MVMQFTVGDMIDGNEIIEIQRDLFDVRDDIIKFGDKTKVTRLELAKAVNEKKYKEEAEVEGLTFDHKFNHCFEGWGEDRYYMADKAHWIYNKMGRGWEKTVTNLKHVYLDGMIAKKDLVDGAIYLGHCRNAGYAQWNAGLGKFEYIRHKFGCEFIDEIEHPEDDRGYDIFVPILKLDYYKALTDCPL